LVLALLAFTVGGFRLVQAPMPVPDFVVSPAAVSSVAMALEPGVVAPPAPGASRARADDGPRPAPRSGQTHRAASAEPAPSQEAPAESLPRSSAPSMEPELVPVLPERYAVALAPLHAPPVVYHAPLKEAPEGITPGAPPPPWNAAADAGVAVGRSSKEAATATAAFFTRFGKRIAASF
jgi:hypothetical protein